MQAPPQHRLSLPLPNAPSAELSPRAKAVQRVIIEETLDPKDVNITMPPPAVAASPRRRGSCSAPSPLSLSGKGAADEHQRA